MPKRNDRIINRYLFNVFPTNDYGFYDDAGVLHTYKDFDTAYASLLISGVVKTDTDRFWEHTDGVRPR